MPQMLTADEVKDMLWDACFEVGMPSAVYMPKAALDSLTTSLNKRLFREEFQGDREELPANM